MDKSIKKTDRALTTDELRVQIGALSATGSQRKKSWVSVASRTPIDIEDITAARDAGAVFRKFNRLKRSTTIEP